MASLRKSTASTELDKRRLVDAFETMRANAADPQRVYSSLVIVYGVLAAHPHCEVLVDAVLSRADAVVCLHEFMRAHTLQEEIQWCLCRVLTLACASSLRFQCQAGQLELWRDVFDVRSAHPGSMRVLQTSLALYEALLRGNEFQLLKARPAQSLIQEMLATIDRFSRPGAGSNSSSAGGASPTHVYEAWRPEMVVAATRVLTAIYASPRVQALVEEKDKTFASAIVTRLVTTFPVFLDSEANARLWLRLARLQIQQHRAVAVPGLLLPPSFSSGITLTTAADVTVDPRLPWHTLLDKWRDSAAVVYDFAALLTLVFALPHEISEHLDALTRELLLGDYSLLTALCELLAALDSKLVAAATATADQYQQTDADELLASATLEIIRVMRQWSADASTRECFERASSRAIKLLMKTLVAQLQRSAAVIQQSAVRSRDAQRALQSALELLLLLQQLCLLESPHSSSSELLAKQLSPVLPALRKYLDARLTTAARGDVNKRDSDMDALVRRSCVKLEKTLARPRSTEAQQLRGVGKRTPQASLVTKASSSHQQPSASTRLLIKPMQSLTRSSSSTRQLLTPSPSSTTLVLRASAATRL